MRAGHGGEDQDLLQTLRTALRSGEPLDFLAAISGFLEVTDPRSRDPLAPDEQRAGLGDLVESFIGTPYAETTAALTVVKALVPDEVVAVRIGRELKTRRHPLPDWLTGLDQARLDPDVWFMTDVLGDGDDYLVGLTLPSGHALSVVIYVDHNLGTVVKDAFVVPEPLEDLAIKMGTLIEDPGPVADADRPGHGAGCGRGGDRLWLAALPAADLGQLADVSPPGRVDAADASHRWRGSRAEGMVRG